MAVFFEGNAYIDECMIKNTDVKNSRIAESTIDMNLENITNVKDPISLQDAATKNYVDSNTSFVTTNVSLSGTSGSLVFTIPKGVFIVKIASIVTNGPSATFNIVKSIDTRCGQTNRFSATTGLDSNTSLFVDWGIDSNINLRKSNDLYDGEYNVVLL